MTAKVMAVLDEIEGRRDEPSLPVGVSALQLLQMVYRGEVKASPQQMRAAIECLPFENPKLSSVAHLTNEELFAARLDAAIARSLAGPPAKLIEAQAIEIEPEQ